MIQHLAAPEAYDAGDLTPIQATRLAKRIQGESLATIAEDEGVTKQAIAKSLDAPKVKQAAFMLLGRPLGVTRADTEESIDLVCEAIQVIGETMRAATRAVVLTESYGGSTQQRIEHVPDHQTRLTAALRLISLVDRQDG